MISAGRTYREAIEAGTLYEIRGLDGRGSYAPPACESPEEVIACARQTFDDVRPGDTFRVLRHLPGSRFGAAIIEDCGTITVAENPGATRATIKENAR